MSVNSSSSTNDTHIPQFSFFECFQLDVIEDIFISLNVINIAIVLPLSVCVLVLGFQRWKQQRSSSTTMSPSDFYTYNLAAMELIGGLGCCVCVVCDAILRPNIKTVGIIITTFPWNGTMLFPILICVECYMAVVHPITYIKLRMEVWTKYINAVCIWVHCVSRILYVIRTMSYPGYSLIPNAFQMVTYLIAATFCSSSILYVLIRPRPAEASRDQARVDRSKWKAFQTVLIIEGVLLLRFGGSLVCNLVITPTASYKDHCLLKITAFWLNLPSSLVLPLMFFHRVGKLPGCKHNSELFQVQTVNDGSPHIV